MDARLSRSAEPPAARAWAPYVLPLAGVVLSAGVALAQARDPEPPTCARCGKPWREPHRFYPHGDAQPLCAECYFEPEPHEQIDALALRGSR